MFSADVKMSQNKKGKIGNGENNNPQPAQKVLGKTEYLPANKTATLVDSNNKETIIRNITHEQYNEISNAFLSNSTLPASDKPSKLSKSLAASSTDGLSNLKESGIKANKKTEK
jgi:hypothetical protein